MSGPPGRATWAELGKMFAEAAERARCAGDPEAMVVLLVKASECTKIARYLDTPAERQDP